MSKGARVLRIGYVLGFFALVLLAGLRPAHAAITATGTGLGLAGSDAAVVGSVIDPAGNLYVTGTFSGASLTLGNDTSGVASTLTGPAGFIAKYNTSRQVVWASKIFTATGTPSITAIQIDGASPPNVYVGGYHNIGTGTLTIGSTVHTLVGFANGFAIKLDGSTGGFSWNTLFRGANAGFQVNDIVATSAGSNVYLVGMSYNSDITHVVNDGVASSVTLTRTGNQNAIIIKLDGTGAYVNGELFGGAGAAAEMKGVTVDSSNNVYAVGYAEIANLTQPALTRLGSRDGFAVKYDASFARQWMVNYGSGGASYMTPTSVVADGANFYFSATLTTNVTLNSVVKTKVGTTDGLVVKADTATGGVTWSTNFGGTSATLDGFSTVLDSSGNLYIGGKTNVNLTVPARTKVGTADAIVVKLDSTGAITDSASFGGVGASYTPKTSRGISTAGEFALVGTFTGANFTSPAVTKVGTTDGLILRMPASYPVTVTKAGTGSGTVTSSVGGMSCGSTCTAVVGADSSVTLTATASAGSSFTGWSGACSGTGTATLTISATTACTATFTVDSVTQTVVQPTTTIPPPWYGAGGSGELSFSNLQATVDSSGRVNVSIPEGNFNDSGLTFTVSLDDGSALPSWLTFDSATRSFSGVVPTGDVGPTSRADRPRSAAAVSASGRPLATPPSRVSTRITVMITVTDNRGRRAVTTFPLTIYFQRTAAEVVAVSVTDRGVAATGASAAPSLSDDGQAVVFQTSSTNLFSADANPTGPDVIRYDVYSGVLERFSTSTFMGSIANGAKGWNGNASISADARYIAFASDAADIGQPWNYGSRQVWISDATRARATAIAPSPVAVSAAADGTLADGASDHPSMSQDGRYIAFDSMAGNLVAGVAAGTRRVYRKDRTTGAVVLVSSDASGTPFPGTSEYPSISADGRYVAFESPAGGVVQIHRKDLTTGAVVLVSATAANVAGTGPSTRARISRDGRYVAFQAASFQGQSSNLTGTATTQVMRKDLTTGALLMASASAAGAPADAAASAPSISGDGRFVAFVTAAGNLGVAGNGMAQVVVRDAVAGTLGLASTTTANTAANGASGDPALSGDGRFVAFASTATDLAAGMTAGQLYMAGNPLQAPLATGWWWNPDEPGRGYAIEVSGDRMKLDMLAYAADGTPTWYTGTGTISATAWSAPLQIFGHGPTLSTVYQAPVVVGSATTAAMTIASQGSATLTAVNATALRRFDFVTGGVATGPQLGSPESGWWWTEGEGGTGWFLEVQGASLFLSGHYYDSRGQANWISSTGTMSTPKTYTGRLRSCSGGQTLGGAYRVPSCTDGETSIVLAFTSPISATLTLPSGRQIALQRYRF